MGLFKKWCWKVGINFSYRIRYTVVLYLCLTDKEIFVRDDDLRIYIERSLITTTVTVELKQLIWPKLRISAGMTCGA